MEKQKEEHHINKVVVFTTVALSLMMSTVDTTIVATALDTLQEELNTTVNWVGWTITAYSFGFVLMLPLSAKLTKLYGARRLFLISIGIFSGASLLCGFSNSIYLLIPLRVVQAIGAAGITPSVTAIIVDYFGSARDRAVGLFGSIFSIGVMIGPVFGGLFVTYWTWRWIFFVNVPIGIAVILLSLKYIPKDPERSKKQKSNLDFKGAILLAIGLLSSMFAITYLGEKEATLLSTTFLGLSAVAIVGMFGFFRHVKRVKDPFIQPRFIYGRGFGAVNLLNILFSGATSGVLGLVPLFAASRYGIDALGAATLLIAQGGASVLFSIVMTIYLRRTGYHPPLYAGTTIIVLGIILVSLQPQFGIDPYFWLAVSTSLIGIGIGVISPAARNACLQLAPNESAMIAALRSLSLQLGSILSVSVATAIIAGAQLPGKTHANVYLGIALLLVFVIPIISRIPEHKGSW